MIRARRAFAQIATAVAFTAPLSFIWVQTSLTTSAVFLLIGRSLSAARLTASAALEKERAALDKDRQELAEERKILQAKIELERRSWKDERLQGVRDDVLSALSSSRLRQTVINPVIQRSGVYFLKQQGEIIYCGQSVNMFARVQQHVGKNFDGVLFFACEPHELNKWEGFFIRLLRPRLNGGCGAADTNAFAPTSELWDRVQVWANDIDEADIPWMAEQSPPPRKRGRGR